MSYPQRVALVTGGAYGIGRATVRGFASRGDAVVIADVNKERGQTLLSELRAEGRPALFLPTDIRREEEVRQDIDLSAGEWGRLDVLCNNAAYLTKWHDVTGAAADEWDRCLSVGLLGAVHFIREVVPLMVPRRSGSIVNIASIQGLVGARGSAAYTSMKHAVVGLTRSVAYDYAPHNIRVNAVCPGPIDTRIAAKPGDELYERQISKTPMGRVGQPREVACAALFLASDEASYITGAVLPVDGGWTAI